jgi:hypothetical protein
MLLSLMDIRPEGRTVNTHESSLFTRVRGIGILGSPLAGSWMKPRNTPPRWPRTGPIGTRAGGYYPGLDAYAALWMLGEREVSYVFYLQRYIELAA